MRPLSKTILRTAEGIRERVEALAREIARDRLPAREDGPGDGLVVLGVLSGAFVFMSDLVRRLDLPLECGFITIVEGDRADRMSRFRFHLSLPIEGRDVLLVEDILDTGITLSRLHEDLSRLGPARLRTCVLLDKPSRRVVPFAPEYVGFTVPDVWVVGYGLDDDGWYRNLPYLTSVVEQA